MYHYILNNYRQVTITINTNLVMNTWYEGTLVLCICCWHGGLLTTAVLSVQKAGCENRFWSRRPAPTVVYTQLLLYTHNY
jgi:hypothetical protein